MTGKRNYFLPGSKLQEGWDSPSRNAQKSEAAFRDSVGKLKVYVRPLPPRESDIRWLSDEWMR